MTKYDLVKYKYFLIYSCDWNPNIIVEGFETWEELNTFMLCDWVTPYKILSINELLQ